VWVNAALCELLGYSETELLALDVPSVTHPDDRAAGLKGFALGKAGRLSDSTFDKRYVRKDGGVVWASVHASAVRDPGGELEYFVAQIVDLTERRQVEEALHVSEERYRELVESANDLVFTIDAEGCVLSVNPAAAGALAYRPDELVGRHFRSFLTEESLAWAEEEFRAKLAGTSTQRTYRLDFVARDGRVVPVERARGRSSRTAGSSASAGSAARSPTGSPPRPRWRAPATWRSARIARRARSCRGRATSCERP
jgi:PAS domain S-box-containing protein